MDDIREILAEAQHDIWSHWMKYMFSCGERDVVGNWVMPQEKVVRWMRQMETQYSDLTFQEQESDREMADRILDLDVYNL